MSESQAKEGVNVNRRDPLYFIASSRRLKSALVLLGQLKHLANRRQASTSKIYTMLTMIYVRILLTTLHKGNIFPKNARITICY